MSDNSPAKKKKNQVEVHPHTKRFARHLRFTPDDLVYNRRGYLSPRQLKTVRTSMIISLFIYLVGIIFFAGVIAIIFAIPWAKEIMETEGIFANIPHLTVLDWTLLIAGGVIVGLFALMIRKIILSNQNIKQRQVKRYVGPANRRQVEYTNRASYRDDKYIYTITINNRTFDVDEVLFKLCERNFVYCAYVASSMDTILAIEVVSNLQIDEFTNAKPYQQKTSQ